MIVSHKHKFIFLKTEKTASSSMEIALSHYCGPDDIITPTRDDLAEQRAIAGQNFRIEHPEKPKRPLWRILLGRPERLYHPTVGFYEHIPAWRVKTYLGDDTWNAYFKFVFVRNPWDAQLSYYFYKTRKQSPRPPFETFLRDEKRARLRSREIYTIDGEIAVDFIGRYENLHADFADAIAKIGIREKVELPLANTSDKPKGRYREFYTDWSKARVHEWYAKEIEDFGYTF